MSPMAKKVYVFRAKLRCWRRRAAYRLPAERGERAAVDILEHAADAPTGKDERHAHVDSMFAVVDAHVQDVALHRAVLPVTALEDLIADAVGSGEEVSEHREARVPLKRAA